MSKAESILDSCFEHFSAAVSSNLWIGPARAKSNRFYRYQDLSVSEIDADGANFPMFLNSLSAKQEIEFSDWVKSLFDFGVKVERDAGHISIKLTDGDSLINVVDTGYGVSQILPVLGQIWWANNRPTFDPRLRASRIQPFISIEQPELHLHPAHQAMLADAFVHATSRAQAYQRELPTFIIETHSEALVNRIGELISSGQLANSDVQIVIFDKDLLDQKATTVKIAEFDENGTLINWPYGFFLP